MQVRQRMTLVGGLASALIVVAGAVGWTAIGTLESAADEKVSHDVPAANLLLNVDRDAYQSVLALEQATSAVDADELEGFLEGWSGNLAQTEERFLLYQDVSLQYPGEVEIWDQYWADRAAYAESSTALAEALRGGVRIDDPAVAAALLEIRGQFETFRTHIDVIVEEIYVPRSAAFAVEVADVASNGRTFLLVSALLAFVVAAALGVWMMRSIGRGLAELHTASGRLAKGHLDIATDYRASDEFGVVIDDFRAMSDRLSATTAYAGRLAKGDLTEGWMPSSEYDSLGQALSELHGSLVAIVGDATSVSTELKSQAATLQVTSGETTAAVDEVAGSIQEIAHAGERQVALSDEVARTIDDIGRDVADAESAIGEASQAAASTATQASDGKHAMGAAQSAIRNVVDTIVTADEVVGQLNQHSAEVRDMVSFIRGIADQTNLLALNAAIEAARAGEAGQGFAVVASEVKGLAEESAGSTDRISEVVDRMVSSMEQAITAMQDGRRQVDDGVSALDATEVAFNSITAAVSDLEARVDSVQEAGARMAGATAAVQTKIGELAQTVEHNGAASEQVAASGQEASTSTQRVRDIADDLAGLATQLDGSLGRFELALN